MKPTTAINIDDIFPYIRGTNRVYGTQENGGFWGENGYNCIEVGYIIMADNAKIGHIIPLTRCADVFSIGKIIDNIEGRNHISARFDCIGDGYMRIFELDSRHKLKWEMEMMPMSEMTLVIGVPDIQLINKRIAGIEEDKNV